MPIIQPNNTTGLYGVDTTVSIGNTLFATNLNVSGNAAIGGNLSVGGNETIAGNLTVVGTLIANVNIAAPGTNTQIVYNNAGALAGTANLAYTGNALSMTGNIDATTINAGNVYAGFLHGNGSNITGINFQLPSLGSGNIWVGNATSVATQNNLASYTGNIGAGNISTGNIAAGNITAVGNITGNYFLGNGSQLTGLPDTYSNANVTSLLASFGSNTISTTGNITSGNLNVGGFSVGGFGFSTGTTILTTNGVIGWAGNGAYLVGYNGANTAGNAWFGADGFNGIQEIGPPGGPGNWTFNNANGNLTLPGNTSAINYANGVSILNGLSSTYGNANVTALMAAFGSNTIVTTGNITAGTLTATQQSIVGLANVGTTGNIIHSGKNIATDVILNADSNISAQHSLSRVTIGTGFNGSTAFNVLPTRLSVSDSFNRNDNSAVFRELHVEPFVNLTANVTNASFRTQGSAATLRVGGGAAANTVALTNAIAAPFAFSPGQFLIEVGNTSAYGLGNTSVSHAATNGGVIGVAAGSTLTNAFGYYTLFNTPPGSAGGASGNITNYTGYTTSSVGTVPVSGNVFMFYNGNSTSSTARNAQVGNGTRAATNYYFLMNDDDVAQVQLGSLRRYHEFESATATSGSFAIDKNTAQVHNIVPTGNCTITGYSNMVVTANDSVNDDPQVDTLTIIVEQGATPYTITLPTGAAYKYAGNVSTVGATANSVTMISVTAANISGTTTYLTTVSPEFV